MKLKSLLILLGSLAAGIFSPAALAFNCQWINGGAPITRTAPLLTANISVGADVLVGTVIHRQNVNGTIDNREVINCSREGGPIFYIDQYLNLTNTPALVPGWTGVYAGALYQTSVPGIGVAITNNDGYGIGTAVSTTPYLKFTTEVSAIPGFNFYYGNRVVLNFVKTGPISAGVINAATFPTVLLTTRSAVPITGNAAPPNTPYRINFSGSMSVVVNTCRTPDVLVPMGKYEVGEYFKGRDSTTPWVSIPINLRDCPPFYGSYSNAATAPTYWTSGEQSAGTVVKNAISIALVPTYGIINAATGIIRLDNDPNVATGIGIQLAQGSDASATPLNLAQMFRYDMQTGGIGNFIMPFQARYIQTADAVTPGPANSKLTFTVGYY